MLVKHPQYEWILYQRLMGGFEVHCALCHIGATVTDAQASAFVTHHSAHRSGSATHHGAGDAFAVLAKPVARLLGKKPGCLPCEQRRLAMNRAVPAVPFLRRR